MPSFLLLLFLVVGKTRERRLEEKPKSLVVQGGVTTWGKKYNRHTQPAFFFFEIFFFFNFSVEREINEGRQQENKCKRNRRSIISSSRCLSVSSSKRFDLENQGTMMILTQTDFDFFSLHLRVSPGDNWWRWSLIRDFQGRSKKILSLESPQQTQHNAIDEKRSLAYLLLGYYFRTRGRWEGGKKMVYDHHSFILIITFEESNVEESNGKEIWNERMLIVFWVPVPHVIVSV